MKFKNKSNKIYLILGQKKIIIIWLIKKFKFGWKIIFKKLIMIIKEQPLIRIFEYI